jgi:N-acetylglucosaminyltransferase
MSVQVAEPLEGEPVVEPSLYAVVALYLAIAVLYAALQEHNRRKRDAAATSRRQSGPPWPGVDVVLPCYNEDPAVLAACCASLEAQDYPGELHVFLIDDGSNNRDVLAGVYQRYSDHAGWTVLLLDHNGKRKAQDAAVSAGTGELVVTVDSDTVFAPDGIRRLVGAFADPRVGAVTGDVRAVNSTQNRLTRLIDERYRLLFEHERAAQSRVGAVLCCAGPFSAYRRSALQGVWAAYLSQTFMGNRTVAGDDIHLTNLVLANGYNSLYEPSAKAFTTVPSTLRPYLRQQLRWNRSFYRELVPTLGAMTGRDRIRYLALDVVSRLLLPLLLAIGLTLAVMQAIMALVSLAEPSTALAGFGALALAGVVSAGLLRLKTSKPDFVLLYGLIYVGLLIPVRLWALGTIREEGWCTRRLERSARRRSEAPTVTIVETAPVALVSSSG